MNLLKLLAYPAALAAVPKLHARAVGAVASLGGSPPAGDGALLTTVNRAWTLSILGTKLVGHLQVYAGGGDYRDAYPGRKLLEINRICAFTWQGVAVAANLQVYRE